MDAEKLLMDAQRFFIEGDPLVSIRFFTKYIESGRRTELAFLSRGVAYLRVGRVDDSIADFGEAIVINNVNARAYFYRGTAFMTKEYFKDAIADFDRTIELRSDYGDAFLARGVVYAMLGNQYEAARNIRTAMKFSSGLIEGAPHAFKVRFDRVLDFAENIEDPHVIGFTDDEMVKIKKWVEK